VIFNVLKRQWGSKLRRPEIAASDPDPLSLLPSAGREMSTGQSAMMLSGWGVKVGWLSPFVDKRVGDCR